MRTGDLARLVLRRLPVALLGAAVLAAFLLMQHFRHGWPFSLHHGLGTPARAGSTQSPKTTATGDARTAVHLPDEQLQALGIRFEPARVETIANPVRAVATVVPDESRLSHAHTRVAGWIEKLYVNTTGERVKAGQPLAGIFSQELFASQSEYLAALKAAVGGPRSVVVDSARTRLRVLGMSEGEVAALEQRGTPSRLVTVTAPSSGAVLHRGVSVGTAVDPSTELMTVADLSRVWVLAEVPEAEAAAIREGTHAMLDFPGARREPFGALVEFIYPTLTERTRTLRVRFAVDNPDWGLRPGLYGTAEFHVAPRQTLTVPRDAVVDTGTEQHVFIVTGPGHLEPKRVDLGARLSDRVEVRQGVAPGQQVVASGVFLIDSESRLRASGGAGMGHAHGNQGGSEAPKAKPEGHEGQGASEPKTPEKESEPPANPHSGHGG